MHKQSQFTSKFILTSVRKQSNLMDIIITLFYYKTTQSFASVAHRSSECAVVSEIQTLNASINLSCQYANNLNREMYSVRESFLEFFSPPSNAHISSRPDFRTLLAQETFATVRSLQNALH